MLVSMLFDDDDESSVTGVWEIGRHFVTIKQRVQEGRQLDEEKERAQEQVRQGDLGSRHRMGLDAQASLECGPSPALQAMVQLAEGGASTSGRDEGGAPAPQGAYDSAFPNVRGRTGRGGGAHTASSRASPRPTCPPMRTHAPARPHAGGADRVAGGLCAGRLPAQGLPPRQLGGRPGAGAGERVCVGGGGSEGPVEHWSSP